MCINLKVIFMLRFACRGETFNDRLKSELMTFYCSLNFEVAQTCLRTVFWVVSLHFLMKSTESNKCHFAEIIFKHFHMSVERFRLTSSSWVLESVIQHCADARLVFKELVVVRSHSTWFWFMMDQNHKTVNFEVKPWQMTASISRHLKFGGLIWWKKLRERVLIASEKEFQLILNFLRSAESFVWKVLIAINLCVSILIIKTARMCST